MDRTDAVHTVNCTNTIPTTDCINSELYSKTPPDMSGLGISSSTAGFRVDLSSYVLALGALPLYLHA